jgi:hypothetical protein
MYSQAILRLTADEAQELGAAIFELLEPYFPKTRKDAPADAVDVSWVGFGVPREP